MRTPEFGATISLSSEITHHHGSINTNTISSF